MKLGTIDIDKVFLGSTEGSKIYLGNDEVWSASNPPTWTDFDYNDNTNLSEASNIWTCLGGSGWDAGRGVSNLSGKFISSSIDGAIRFEYTGATSGSNYVKFGLNASSSQANAIDFDYGLAIVGDEIYRFSSNTNSSFATGVTLANGDLVAINRVSGTITIEKSVDGGSNWTVVYTYGGTDTNALYPVCSFFFTDGSYNITNPKIK